MTTEGLLEPHQEDRDDYGSLKSFAEADEEYCEYQGVSVPLWIADSGGWCGLTGDREDVGSHRNRLYRN